MPYEWLPPVGKTRKMQLWPHRSLGVRGFVWFIAVTSALIALPLLAVIGSPVLWGLLPFLLLAIWGIWFALRKNGRDRDIVEDMTLTQDLVTLSRHGPGDQRQDWQANPHWVRVTLHDSTGPVPKYLTLAGDGREVEIGAFLTPEERLSLRDELQRALAEMRDP
ncbi:MAG: DUF2244 domain-containing protein [Tabrizicola sp.]|nr:DUF2244 domain-containing protein [Tabrizicola sp.]